MTRRSWRLLTPWALLFFISSASAQTPFSAPAATPVAWSTGASRLGPSWLPGQPARPPRPPIGFDRSLAESWSLTPPRGDQLPPPAPSAYRLPGEFERQGTIFLGCGELATFFPDLLADVVETVRRRVDVAALVTGAEGRKAVADILVARGLPADAVHYVKVPHDTMWVRDYGPVFVRRASDGQALIVDPSYERFARPLDDAAPERLATLLRMSSLTSPLSIEGGNLLSNGHGLGLTTTTLLQRNRELGCSEDRVRNLLREYFGIQQAVFLEPLAGEPTGHADMFAVFTDPGTVVVGQYDPRIDPENAAVLERNAAVLGHVRGPDGFLRVVRVPMPSREGGIWRTYTNVVFANGVLLRPGYGELDPQQEHGVTDVYRRLLPGWKIAPIDVSGLIANGGALHCISMNAPRLLHWPASPETPSLDKTPLTPVAAVAPNRIGE